MKKQQIKDDKFRQAIDDLAHAVTFSKEAERDRFYFAGITKSFETCVEYAWKYFKRLAIDEGLEVYSPKDAIRAAGRLGLIDDVEKWLGFVEDRNLAVHDYLGVSIDDYMKTIRVFLAEVKKLDV
ncbi:MAG: HI0074 family nucleotidyltransferase substrate-binding subunit [bacterium]